ncbi:MAG: hypothetical protein U0P45_01655 [Acidimicrobiales bacterium]
MGVRGVPPHLAVGRLHLEARRPGGDDDRGDLRLAGAAGRVGAGGDGDERRDVRARVGDERLLAVDHPLVGGLVEHGAGAGAAGIAAGFRLGEPEAAEGPAGEQVRQPALLLLLRAEREDRVGAEPDARLQSDRRRLVDAGELLDGDAQGGEVRPRAAVLLREGQAEEAQLAHGQDRVGGERVVSVPRLGVGCDLGFGEVPHHLAELLLLVGEVEVHRRRA